VLGGTVLVPQEPRLPHTSVLNVLFDSRWVIAGVRLVALAAAFSLLMSLVVRI